MQLDGASDSWRDVSFDPLVLLAGVIEEMTGSPNYKSESIQTKVVQVEAFHEEVAKELQAVKDSIESIRNKVRKNRGSSKNFKGFLLGEVDEYLDNYDQQVVKFDTAIGIDKEHWLNKRQSYVHKE